MKFKLTGKVLKAGIVVLLSLMTAIIVITIITSQKMKDTAKRVAHTQEVLFYSQKVLSLALDNETGARGYTITGNKTFLQPLEKSQKEIFNTLRVLKVFTSDNASQQIHIDSLRLYIDKRVAYSNSIIRIYDEKDAAAAMAMFETGEGKLYTEHIRFLVDKIDSAEKALLQQQKLYNDDATRWLNNMLIALAIAVLLLVIILLRMMNLQFTLINSNKDALQKQVQVKTGELDTVFERITDAFVALDSNGCFTYMNKKAGEILALDPAAVIGKNVWQELPETVGHTFYKAYYKAMQEQQYMCLEEYFPPYDQWFENRIYPSPNGLSIFFGDITQQKKNARELEITEERFQVLIENNQGIISLTDDSLNSIYRSPSFESIIGWTAEDLKVTGGINYFHPDDINIVKTAVAEAIKKPGIPQFYISRYLHKNGKYIYLESTATKLQDDSLIQGIIFNSRDVTERIGLHQLLVKATKLARIGTCYADLVQQTVFWDDITREIHEADKGFVPDFASGAVFYKEGPGRNLMTLKVEEAVKSGKSWDEEVEIVTVKNNVRWIRSIGEPEFVNGKCIKIYGSFQDIDQRKKAEDRIKQNEEKQRTILQSLLGYVLILNDSGLIQYINQITPGLTQKEVIGSNWLQWLDEEDQPKAIKAIGQTLSTGMFSEIQVRSIGPQRKVAWYHIKIVCLPHVFNQQVLLVSTDITERKEIEEKIRSSEARLLRAQEIGKFGYWHQEINSDTVWASKEAMRIYGFEPMEGELDREKISACIIDVEKVKEAATNLVEHDKEYNIEIRVNPADGSTMKYISVLAQLEKNEQGSPLRIIGTLQDITERKKAESKLVENENYLRTILDTEPECVKVLDSKGELVSMNPAGLAMIEADNEKQVLGHRMTELVDQKYRTGFNALSKEVFNGRSGTYEFEVTGLKGGHRWLETHAVPLRDSQGNIISLLGVTRDITQRKKAEIEIVKATEDLRQLTTHLLTVREEERKRIAREIHDDLGQQLTAIKMDTVWIDKQISPDKVAVKNKVQNIIQLLDSSHHSVRKILNELRPAVLDDNSLLEVLKWQGQQFTETTGTPVHFTTNQNNITLPQETATSIFRVYQESLTNIMRYASAGKVVSSLNIVNDSILFEVEDDGEGFDTGIAEGKKRFGILGMKERVYSLKGQFDLISSPGKGTKIVVSLPYQKS